MPHPIPPEYADLVAERFRLLAEPMRIRILDALRDGPLTVGVLAGRVGATQQNVSKHLGLLHGGGLVSKRKHGTSVHYEIADAMVFDLCEQVCGGIERRLEELRAMLGEGVAR